MNSAPIYVEDVTEGQPIKPLIKKPNYVQIVKWSNAQGNLGDTHYDRDNARQVGLKDVILAGPLLGAMLGQAVEEWAGHVGRIRKYSWRNQNMAYPNDELTVRGKVAKVDSQSGLIECNLEMHSQRGDLIVSGNITIALPSKHGHKHT